MPTNFADLTNANWYTSGSVNSAWDTYNTTYYPDTRRSEDILIAELNRLIALHHNNVDHISIAETLENARRKGDCSESKYRWIYNQIRRPVPGDIVFRGANCQQREERLGYTFGHIEPVIATPNYDSVRHDTTCHWEEV